MPKTRLNISLDQDIADFIKLFAAENRTTVADIVTQYMLALKRREDGDIVRRILSNPVFQEAMEDAMARLKRGTAVWRSYDEVFGD